MNENDALLCLAAKAIGYELKLNQSGSHQLFKDGKYSSFWNPLNDDGDALRLAVKCLPFHVLKYTADDYDRCKQDGNAATRRAIVRAAAAVGEAME